MKEKTAALSFGQFFARWMRLRRDDMLAMLLFPAGFWLLILAVVLVAAAVEGEPFDASAFAIPTAMALVGGVFAGFITGMGSAGVCFTLTVCWWPRCGWAAFCTAPPTCCWRSFCSGRGC